MLTDALKVHLVGGWKSGRTENNRKMEKWKNRKYFNFSLFCLVGSGKVEGWKK